MRAPSDLPRRFSLANHRVRWAIAVLALVVVVALASAQKLASFYTNYLWASSLGFGSVWSKTVTVEIGLGAVFTVLFFALIWGNLVVAQRLAPKAMGTTTTDELVLRWQGFAPRHTRLAWLGASVLFALVGGVSARGQWDNWLLFSNAQPFTAASAPWNGDDPLNHLNDGFYVFRLPFLDWIVGWCFSALVVTLLLCVVAHYLNGGIRPHSPVGRVSRQVKAHLSVLLAALALVEGASYYLQRLSLVLSTKYPVLDGATYTDVHAVRPALLLLVAIAVIAAGLFLYNVRQQGWILPAVAVALWALVWGLVANVYPDLVQALVVKPAQNVKEAPYLTDNITATTAAYGLDGVVSVPFSGNATLTAAQLSGNTPSAVANRQSLDNIPLLDPDLPQMNSVFTKQQGFRGYYSMSGPSTDRYDLPTGPGGRLQETQVLVSARELNPQQVPPSWVNQHLEYTHGYGAVLAPADQAGVDTANGYPNFSLRGVPPTGEPSLTQPSIYFDTSQQSASGYVIANSDEPELDYEDPTTGAEVSTHYSGTGGVPLGGFFRRLAFSVSFGDFNILISDQVTSHSRILYYRNVVQRLQQVAPFLSYDSNPYPVVLDGQIYWVDDAYTTTDNFPYSEQANTSRLPSSSELANQQFNYIRNSVKAVVNAYSGKTWFFVEDPTDPIIRTYQRAFPHLFIPMARADNDIPGITEHWRYPKDLFTVQTNMYTTYHEQTTSIFYNGSQAWGVAQNPAAGDVSAATTTTALPGALGAPSPPAPSSSEVAPNYELLALPGQTNQSFVLMQSFVPSSNGDKQNLAAFLAASSDPSDYGDLTLYTLPPGESVDGPALVSTAVQTNGPISQELTLLGQHGSKVLLGDVVLTPIDNAIVYTQPLYVEQQSNGVPRLDDVIVVYDGTAFHSGTANPTIGEALCQVTDPGGGHPFASFCPDNTPRPAAPSTTTTQPTRPAKTTTTTTVAPSATTSTTVAEPSRHNSLEQDLAEANQDFAYADAALKAGDLGTYQADNRAGEALVALAYQLATKPGATTTTTKAPSAVTKAPPGSTISGRAPHAKA